MKKAELRTLTVKTEIESKKTGEIITIENMVEVDGKIKYELSNGKSTTESSMLRWYNIVEQPEVEVENTEETEVENTEQPEIEQLTITVPQEVKLTDLEKEALYWMKNNEYEDCFDVEFFKENEFFPSTWTFAISEWMSCGIQSSKGVLSSLVKKGLVIVDEGEYNYNSKQYDTSVRLTKLGYEVGIKMLETYTPVEHIVEPIEPSVEPVEPVSPIIQPVEPKSVTAQPSNSLLEEIVEYLANNAEKYTIKQNSNHKVVKGSGKNLVEIYNSKTTVSLAVRQGIYTEEEQMNLDSSRIVGNGTYSLDLKFKIHSVEEFIDTLQRADVYTRQLKSKK